MKMRNARLRLFLTASLLTCAIALAACGATATPAPAPTAAPAATAAPAVTSAPAATDTAGPAATSAPAAASTAAPAATQTEAPAATQSAGPTATAVAAKPSAAAPVENRLVELEWPQQMRLGDSDILRLALIPAEGGYTVTADFSEHQTVTRTVNVRRPVGYDLLAIGRLDGVGFDFSPAGDQASELPPGEPVTWRWTLTPRNAGQHRLAVSLLLRWTPQPGTTGAQYESAVFSKALNVDVIALLGMTTAQATTGGLLGLVLGSGCGALALASRRRLGRGREILQAREPNPGLAIEPRPGLTFQPEEDSLLKTLFAHYARLVVESEFRSGYSGARTLLALPIRADGRNDAYTIAKIGDRDAIQREYENYMMFVKDTLPPITARIQEAPVITRGHRMRAALRYTFIGEPGRNPISLREALLANPDPALLLKLFDTFGPNWWMQRRPYTFRLGQEYDRMLPAHYVLEPVSGRGRPLDTRDGSATSAWGIGDCVTLRGIARVEPRADGQSLALIGEAPPGQPPLRIRWLSTSAPNGRAGRVVATRATLLRESVARLDMCGLPDPLLGLAAWLNENVAGSQSTSHGDLNLENVLVGPGGFVWLIDFAQTRDGHTLFDFAHLEAEIIAQVVASQVASPAEYMVMLRARTNPLLNALHEIAGRCLLNASQPREYSLALCLACLGALKFANLQPFSRQLLYLTAAHLGQALGR